MLVEVTMADVLNENGQSVWVVERDRTMGGLHMPHYGLLFHNLHNQIRAELPITRPQSFLFRSTIKWLLNAGW